MFYLEIQVQMRQERVIPQHHIKVKSIPSISEMREECLELEENDDSHLKSLDDTTSICSTTVRSFRFCFPLYYLMGFSLWMNEI